VVSLGTARRKLALGRSLDVLVAEDSELNQLILKSWLAKAGHRVTVTSSGDAMLDALEARTFDLVLIDYNMPDMDGLQALALYHASARPPYIPAIMVSADAQPERARAALNAGFAAFISKPYRIDVLAAEIERVLNLAPATPVGKRKHAVDHAVHAPLPSRTRAEQPIVDLTRLQELVENVPTPEFMPTLLQRFSADAAKVITDMRAALGANDHQALRNLAHALKGNALNVGAAALAGLCSELQQLPRVGFVASAAHFVDEIERLTRESEGALKAALTAPAPTEARHRS
jgi:CheY-like chemotaxis protein